jgi:hypothetical protein
MLKFGQLSSFTLLISVHFLFKFVNMVKSIDFFGRVGDQTQNLVPAR